jgi:RHS repeat-associated protein
MKNYAPRLLLAAALLFTLTGWATAQTTINPTADAYVQGGNNANKNFGTATTLQAQSNATAAKNFDSYLKFDMSAVPAFSSVKLRLYAALSNTGSVAVSIYGVANTTWGETTITWNNKPAPGAALASGTVVNKTFAWYEFDVTSYLAAERAAGRNVVSLALRAPTASTLTVKANSRQASTNKPQLVFTAAPPNVPPSVSLTAPTNGASYTAPATITLTATASDSDGTVTKVEFFYGGTNLIATVTQLPYTFDWTNVAAGSYALTAKATDNLGAITTSSPVNITVIAQAALYYIHPDHLNTPRVITNQAQQVVWRWDNDDPVGGNMASENPSGLGTFTCNLRFPGQYFDRETNNHYNLYRDYSPDTGRYIESDPIGLRGGLNSYSYAGSSPVTRIDPKGLIEIEYIESINMIYVYDDFGEYMFACKAGNNVTGQSKGPWPMGFNDYSYYKPHPESGPIGPYGSHGILLFDVPGRTGMGLHSGRSGPESKTEGCIRTTDPCMDVLNMLHQQTPITMIMVH